MKKIYTTLARISTFIMLLFYAFTSNGQAWRQQNANRSAKPKNFPEIQQSFQNYWKDKIPAGKNAVIPKGQGYKQFKRWEWFWEPRVGKAGVFPSSSVRIEEWKKYLAAHPHNKEVFGSATPILSPRNPSNNPSQESGVSTTVSGDWAPLGPTSTPGGYAGIGRLNCITFHPTDINTFWVGSPGGGIWKTTTGGTSWTSLGDNLPELGVSAIVVNPTNPNIMYIATGDKDHWQKNFSLGVMKTTNGGATWSTTGLSYEASDEIRIKGLLMHPTNPLLLLAATSDGIYQTTDGGTNWQIKEYGNFQEIIFNPGNPKVVYASTSSFGDAQIFRSTNTGNTWTQVTHFYGFERIALAVTPANPAIVGALCSNNYDSGFGGYYTSTNSGSSFDETYAAGDLNLLGYSGDGSSSGGQGWYDLCVSISPTNPNRIHVGGVNNWNSTDGGLTWTLTSIWSSFPGVQTVHADKHALAYNPINPGTLYECNDGGLYKTEDGGSSWTNLSNGLLITQFYRLGNSVTNADVTLAGAQDNGTKLKNTSAWTDVYGGDGMECIIDYTDANIMYATTQNGEIYKSTNAGANFYNISYSLPTGAWVTPYAMDPVNPQILYAGYTDVYKTIDGGSTWSLISEDLAFNYLQNLAIAPSHTQTIFAGTYYDLYKTTDGGANWETLSLPDPVSALTSIEIHPTNANKLWITCSGYNSGSKVYRSDNGGLTWTNISGTLPNLPVNTIEYDKDTGVLYIGTDVGVFVRDNTMADWQTFDTGLPNVIVSELEIQYSARRLRAATFGRGLWESNLYKKEDSPLTTQWDKRYGGSHNEGFAAVIKTADGGYLSGGSSPSGKSGDKTQPSQGKNDFWIVKSDDKGKKIWDKRYGGTADEYLMAMVQTLDGGYLLAGSSLSDVGGDKTQASRGNRDYWIVKISSTGAKQWDKRFGGSGTDDLKRIFQLPSGNVLLAGISNSPADGDKSQYSRGGQDYWIVKINKSGTKLWDKRYGGSADESLEGLAFTLDGGYLLGGSSLSGVGGDKTQNSRGGGDYWLVRVDGNGNKLWDKRFGGTGEDNLMDLGSTGTKTGNFFLAGHSTSGLDGDKSQASQGGKDFWMLKINGNGSKLWDKSFGGSSNEGLRSIMLTTDGGYLLGGRSESGVSGDKTQPSQGSSDYWLVKTTSTGMKQWDARFGGSGYEEIRSVVPTSEGGYLLGGRSNSDVSGDRTQPSQGGNDYWLIKVEPTTGTVPVTLAAATNKVSEQASVALTKRINLKAYPNPFQNQISIHFTVPQTQLVQLKVYDSQGREITTLFQKEALANQDYQLEWQAGSNAAGMYLLQLQTPTTRSQQKLLLTK